MPTIDEVLDKMAKGKTAGHIHSFLKEYFDVKIQTLTRTLCNAEPNFEVLLDVRAKIRAIKEIEQDLLFYAQKGKDAKFDQG